MEAISIVDEMLAEVAGDAVEHYEFTTASAPRTFRCRVLRDADALQRAIRRIRRFQRCDQGNTPAAWHPYVPVSAETARTMAYAEAAGLEVKRAQGDSSEWVPLTNLDLLRLAKGAGPLFLEIGQEVMTAQLGAQIRREVEVLDELGEG